MTRVCIITALAAESRPFIDRYKLRAIGFRGHRLYAGEHCLLLQTGVGKLKAACATAALLHARPETMAVINTGIAGGTAKTGTPVIAHCVTDASTGYRWYPHLPPQRITAPLSSGTLTTVDNPCVHYTDQTIYDMEAAGIMTAATHYLDNTAIQCIKIVSDNHEIGLANITKQFVADLMPAAFTAVDALLDWHLNHDNNRYSGVELDKLLVHIESHVHHTINEHHLLQRVLQKYLSVTGRGPEVPQLLALGSAKSISRHLQQEISAHQICYEL